MIDPHQGHQHQHHDPVELSRHDDRRHGREQHASGHPVAGLAKDGAADVPAVELAHRHHVEPRHEQSHPAGHEERIGGDRGIGGQVGPYQRLHPTGQRRHREGGVGIGAAAGQEPECQQRHGHREPGERAGHRDIEELPAIGPRSLHADHGTERAREQDRHRDEERECGGDAVDPCGDEVARLVRREHGHHGGGIGQAAGPVGREVGPDLVEAQEQRLPAGCAGRERGHARQ